MCFYFSACVAQHSSMYEMGRTDASFEMDKLKRLGNNQYEGYDNLQVTPPVLIQSYVFQMYVH